MIPPRAEHGYSLVELLAVVALLAIVAGVALPMTASALSAYRLPSDARAVAQELAVTRMRAAARSTRTRLYFNLAAGQYFGQTWNRTTSVWDSLASITRLSRGVTFGFGTLAAPPANTQTVIRFSAACRDEANAVIADTACVVFNSRGIPIDSVGAPSVEMPCI